MTCALVSTKVNKRKRELMMHDACFRRAVTVKMSIMTNCRQQIFAHSRGAHDLMIVMGAKEETKQEHMKADRVVSNSIGRFMLL